MNLSSTRTRPRGPADELSHRLDITIERSSGPPTLEELTTTQPFATVETWRNVARAATLAEHDFDAGLGYGRLSQAQCRTLLKDAADVVRGIVALGSALGLTITAEGVENREELIALQKMGCQLVQGYFFTRPLTATDFDTWWRQTRANPGLLVATGTGSHDAIVV